MRAQVIADWRTVDVMVIGAASEEEAIDRAMAEACLCACAIDDVTCGKPLRGKYHVEFTIRTVAHDPDRIRAFVNRAEPSGSVAGSESSPPEGSAM